MGPSPALGLCVILGIRGVGCENGRRIKDCSSGVGRVGGWVRAEEGKVEGAGLH